MKTLKKIQLAATVVALIVAVKLADNVQPTTNELIGSVALVFAGCASTISLVSSNERKEEAQQ